jgi:hypothetical protein
MSIKVTGGHVQIGDGNTQVVSGRCKTCAHWQEFMPRNVLGLANEKRLGVCGRIIDEREARPTDDEQVLALTEDLSGCSGLRTAATFGCVLWESK